MKKKIQKYELLFYLRLLVCDIVFWLAAILHRRFWFQIIHFKWCTIGEQQQCNVKISVGNGTMQGRLTWNIGNKQMGQQNSPFWFKFVNVHSPSRLSGKLASAPCNTKENSQKFVGFLINSLAILTLLINHSTSACLCVAVATCSAVWPWIEQLNHTKHINFNWICQREKKSCSKFHTWWSKTCA